MKKRTGSKRTVSVKAFVAILALVLALGCAAGGTFAWLTAQTQTVTNTFTYGNIDITLSETKPNGQKATIIPGMDIEKDPKVTVSATSEDCWLFVKVEATGTFVQNKVTYEIADGWNELEGNPGVYYREVKKTDTVKAFDILKGNKVTVSDTLTKEDIKNITGNPTLAFTAYAVQRDGIDSVTEAWAKTSA